jgi:magnesium-transporting ATPase (P-type)
MTPTEPIWNEEKQKQQLLKTSKFLFLCTIIYSLWTAFLIMSVYFLQFENKWAILTIEQWILTAIVFISIAIVLEIILLLYYTLSRKKHILPEKQLTFLEGKKVHNYTIPVNAKGGIFSKTYILIDEERILNFRYQMIPSKDLWGQKE